MKKLMLVLLSIVLFAGVVSAQTFQIYEKTTAEIPDKVAGKEYIVYLDTKILATYQYRDLFYLFDNAAEKDVIVLKINTSGGKVGTTIQLMESIKNCKGKVIGEIFYAMSAGAMVAFSCDEVRVADYGVVLIHNIGGTVYGSTTRVESRSNLFRYLNNSAIRNLYKGFLTKREIHDIIKNDKQMWLFGDEIKKRLKNMKEKK